MIELNLLPKELRKKDKRQMPEIKIVPIAISVVAVLVAAHLFLAVLVGSSNFRMNKLREQWEGLKPQKEKTDKAASEMVELDKRMNAVRKIAKPPVDWARMLSGMNQAVVPNVWLNEFKPVFDKAADQRGSVGFPKYLELSGYALGKSETATTTVARFINSLKKTADFSDYFEDVELEMVNSRVVAGEEAMVFKLTCRFKHFGPPQEAKKEAKGGKKKAKAKAVDEGKF